MKVKPQAYRDEKGREIFAGKIIGPIPSSVWGALRINKNGSTQRVMSPLLPKVPSIGEAQQKLNSYAERRGWGKIPTCKVCGCTDQRGCKNGCEWIESNLCSSCAPKR